jgi:uncharacterized protein (TIGR00251 family)
MQLQTTELRVRVNPRSSNPGIGARRGGTLIVRLASPPVEDQANTELIKVVAKAAGVAKGKVTIVRGEKSRDKLLSIEGLTDSELSDALAAAD